MNHDQKIKELLNAYTKVPTSEAFVRNVMRRIRQEEAPASLFSRWFTFPRVTLAAAACAALLFTVTPRSIVQEPAGQEPVVAYVANVLDAPAVTTAEEPDTEALIETYFL